MKWKNESGRFTAVTKCCDSLKCLTSGALNTRRARGACGRLIRVFLLSACFLQSQLNKSVTANSALYSHDLPRTDCIHYRKQQSCKCRKAVKKNTWHVLHEMQHFPYVNLFESKLMCGGHIHFLFLELWAPLSFPLPLFSWNTFFCYFCILVLFF